MTGFEIALIVGAGIVVAFTFGFIFGMSYQGAEDRHEIKMITMKSKATIEEMKNRSIEAIRDAYKEQENRKKDEMISIIYGVFDDNVKYGGF